MLHSLNILSIKIFAEFKVINFLAPTNTLSLVFKSHMQMWHSLLYMNSHLCRFYSMQQHQEDTVASCTYLILVSMWFKLYTKVLRTVLLSYIYT